ncbi:hypothetical protein GPECTOR_37g220 [Gonium pectorale]|uniref:Uncharacterized protein n=1 Tax=Gonium pectorale TaxID=33097 RepID=A0A150GBJ8_GONPE|nr:hypothetical protein GPECTOR_37g220 [Gonium pectorale]|eukprot:KXZ47214.1 hypothetical protein GPECTOR_37g220 [Gonium pectorale]
MAWAPNGSPGLATRGPGLPLSPRGNSSIAASVPSGAGAGPIYAAGAATMGQAASVSAGDGVTWTTLARGAPGKAGGEEAGGSSGQAAASAASAKTGPAAVADGAAVAAGGDGADGGSDGSWSNPDRDYCRSSLGSLAGACMEYGALDEYGNTEEYGGEFGMRGGASAAAAEAVGSDGPKAPTREGVVAATAPRDGGRGGDVARGDDADAVAVAVACAVGAISAASRTPAASAEARAAAGAGGVGGVLPMDELVRRAERLRAAAAASMVGATAAAGALLPPSMRSAAGAYYGGGGGGSTAQREAPGPGLAAAATASGAARCLFGDAPSAPSPRLGPATAAEARAEAAAGMLPSAETSIAGNVPQAAAGADVGPLDSYLPPPARAPASSAPAMWVLTSASVGGAAPLPPHAAVLARGEGAMPGCFGAATWHGGVEFPGAQFDEQLRRYQQQQARLSLHLSQQQQQPQQPASAGRESPVQSVWSLAEYLAFDGAGGAAAAPR